MPAPIEFSQLDPNDEDDLKDFLSDAISDGFDIDWQASCGAEDVLHAIQHEGLMIVRQPQPADYCSQSEAPALMPAALALGVWLVIGSAFALGLFIGQPT